MADIRPSSSSPSRTRTPSRSASSSSAWRPARDTISRNRRPSTHAQFDFRLGLREQPARVGAQQAGHAEQVAGIEALDRRLVAIRLTMEQAHRAGAGQAHQLGLRFGADDQSGPAQSCAPSSRAPERRRRVASARRNRSTWRMYHVHTRAAVADHGPVR